ncbi:hypothetical protein K438DRAFT_880409 [Mycena galopus ATCC 62051]|nr:hypothetical protein K438DRAFT_880409 [Mycena galopus ATCC 62051]
MRRQYELSIWQEPRQARMCGIGGKADRCPIDPPVIVQLRVVDPAASSSSSLRASSAGPSSPSRDCENGPQNSAHADSDDPPYTNLASYAQSFLQNRYYFMFALLAKPDDDTELHWHKDGHTRCTSGSVVNSLYAFKDPPAPDASTNNGHASGSPATAKYRPMTASPAPMRASSSSPTSPSAGRARTASSSVCSSLWERRPPLQEHLQRAVLWLHREKVPWRGGILSLTCSLADQGVKIRIQKDIRMRKTRHPGVGVGVGVGGPLPSGAGGEHAHEFLFWQNEEHYAWSGSGMGCVGCVRVRVGAIYLRVEGHPSLLAPPLLLPHEAGACAQRWGCRSSVQTWGRGRVNGDELMRDARLEMTGAAGAQAQA